MIVAFWRVLHRILGSGVSAWFGAFIYLFLRCEDGLIFLPLIVLVAKPLVAAVVALVRVCA